MTNEPQISKSSYELVMKTQTSCWQSPTLSALRCCRSSTRSLSLDTKEEKCVKSHTYKVWGTPLKKSRSGIFLATFRAL